MVTVTFFGHRDCPDSVKPLLEKKIIDLIENHNARLFYVGDQGRFDALVRRVLRDLSIVYPEIDFGVVLAYMPRPGEPFRAWDLEAMLPEGIEEVHPRYAVDWRNRWMLRQADMVVTYITHSWGGAAKYAERAKRQGKPVWNLA